MKNLAMNAKLRLGERADAIALRVNANGSRYGAQRSIAAVSVADARSCVTAETLSATA